jgi:uncharacterized protein (DUF1697 family)
MTIYIALLRGINVGGKNMVKMADLKSMLEKMGLGRVKTYILSGNVLFESEEGADLLRPRIEEEFRAVFGFSISILLRTAQELKRIIANCPYSQDSLTEGQSIHLTVLADALSPKDLDKLSAGLDNIDEFQVQGREVYFYYRQSIRDSKLAKNLAKLGDSVTSRNWNTILKLSALVEAMQGVKG